MGGGPSLPKTTWHKHAYEVISQEYVLTLRILHYYIDIHSTILIHTSTAPQSHT